MLDPAIIIYGEGIERYTLSKCEEDHFQKRVIFLNVYWSGPSGHSFTLREHDISRNRRVISTLMRD